jgi:hypothetical protein
MIGRMKAYESHEFSMDVGTRDSYVKARKKWMKKTNDGA